MNMCPIPKKYAKKSPKTRSKTAIKIVNRTRKWMVLYWVTFRGHWRKYKAIRPRKFFWQRTYVGHRWALKYWKGRSRRASVKYFYAVRSGSKCWKPRASKKKHCWKKAKAYARSAKSFTKRKVHYWRAAMKYKKYSKNWYKSARSSKMKAHRYAKVYKRYYWLARKQKNKNLRKRYFSIAHRYRVYYAKWNKKAHIAYRKAKYYKHRYSHYRKYYVHNAKQAKRNWMFYRHWARKCRRGGRKAKKPYCRLAYKWVKK